MNDKCELCGGKHRETLHDEYKETESYRARVKELDGVVADLLSQNSRLISKVTVAEKDVQSAWHSRDRAHEKIEELLVKLNDERKKVAEVGDERDAAAEELAQLRGLDPAEKCPNCTNVEKNAERYWKALATIVDCNSFSREFPDLHEMGSRALKGDSQTKGSEGPRPEEEDPDEDRVQRQQEAEDGMSTPLE